MAINCVATDSQIQHLICCSEDTILHPLPYREMEASPILHATHATNVYPVPQSSRASISWIPREGCALYGYLLKWHNSAAPFISNTIGQLVSREPGNLSGTFLGLWAEMQRCKLPSIILRPTPKRIRGLLRRHHPPYPSIWLVNTYLIYYATIRGQLRS